MIVLPYAGFSRAKVYSCYINSISSKLLQKERIRNMEFLLYKFYSFRRNIHPAPRISFIQNCPSCCRISFLLHELHSFYRILFLLQELNSFFRISFLLQELDSFCRIFFLLQELDSCERNYIPSSENAL